jgi:hypothetical protein
MFDRLLLIAAFAFAAFAPLDGAVVNWTTPSGEWQDSTSWGGHLPKAKETAEIHGLNAGRLSDGNAVVSRLELGISKRDDALFTMDGGSLFALEFVRIGEAAGSKGKFVLNGGRICTTEIGIGGMNDGSGETPACEAELEIRGGSILTRYLAMGWQIGSKARLHIVGSKADSIVVLNWANFTGPTDPRGSNIELAFDIDAHGVTPITIRNKQSSPAFWRNDRATQCKLRITLLDTPPGGDIPLVRSLKRATAALPDLPEGSHVRAQRGGKTYEWTLTYEGGPGKTDVALTDPHVMDTEGQMQAYAGSTKSRVVETDSAEIKKSYEEMYAYMDRDAPPVGAGQLAFPGAEGYGAHAKGGRGGRVLFVTNLHDSGLGSLRDAVESKGPRTVIFRVGGTIELKKKLDVREPYLTIAGQTAPGEGICVKGANDTLCLRNTHDIVVRYLRVRTGFTGEGDSHEGDCISCYGVDNFILDHCSASWGTDETISSTETSDRYTVQWCIIAEGLNFYGHSMASILGGDRSTWHHNLFAHCGTRNPRFAGLCRPDFRNNVIYDWASAAAYGDLRNVNYVGNYVKPGPSTTQKPPRFIQGDSVPLPGAVFMQDNLLDGHPAETKDNRLGTGFDPEIFASQPNPAPPVEAQPVQAAYDLVLKRAGTIYPKRDATDERIVNDVKNGTGHVIKYESEVGGYATYAGGEALVDSDNDGIPDAWEKSHGLNPNDASDGNQVAADGYTNLEHYLNSLVEQKASVK